MRKLTLFSLAFAPAYGWALVTVLLGAFISLFLSLQAGVFVLFFAVLGWWAWHAPEDAFLLLVVISPLFLVLKITQTIGTATLLKDVIILVLFVRLVLWPLWEQRLPYRRNVLFAPMAALAVWTVIGTLRADSLVLGVLRARDILLYLLLYFVVLYLEHEAAARRRLYWWGLSLAVVLWLAVYQWFFAVDSAVLRYDPARQIWIPRLSSIMAHPSILGQYLVAAAGLAGAGALAGGSRGRWLWAGLGVALLPLVYLTYSRAVWFGLAAAGIALGIGWLARTLPARRTRRISAGSGLLVLALVGVLALLIIYTPVGVYLRSAFDPTYGSNEERIEFMARLIAPLTNTEAVLGRGLGDVLEQNFREVDLAAYDIASGAARTVQLTKNRTLVDNQWLKTFVEMGLVGLLIYAWLFWRVARHAWHMIKLSKEGISSEGVYQRTVGLWTIGFLAAFILQGFFIDIWDIFPTNAAFWIVAALASAAGSIFPAVMKRAPRGS